MAAMTKGAQVGLIQPSLRRITHRHDMVDVLTGRTACHACGMVVQMPEAQLGPFGVVATLGRRATLLIGLPGSRLLAWAALALGR